MFRKSSGGAIRTKEKCPRCGGKFFEQAKGLRCPKCKTIPSRYFLDLWCPGHGRLKIYSDQQGYPLDSWERAGRLLIAISHEIDQGKFDPQIYLKQGSRALLFHNYAEEWMKRRQQAQRHQHISKSYLTDIQAYLRRFFIPFFGGLNIRDIREAHIEDFSIWLPEALSRKTVRNILGVLHKLFQDAYRRKDILTLPEFPKIEKTEPVTRWLTEEEQYLVLGQMKDKIRRAFYLFLMKQGCRPGEARALKWPNIDFKNDMVTIASSFDREEFRPFTKEREVRYLPLHPEVKQALLSLVRHITGFVFTYRGEPISQWMASAYWRRAARKVGITVSCYEGTRHSLASQAINRGVSERKIGDFLGHKNLTSTRRYAKLRAESLKEVWGEDYDQHDTVPRMSPTRKPKPELP